MPISTREWVKETGRPKALEKLEGCTLKKKEELANQRSKRMSQTEAIICMNVDHTRMDRETISCCGQESLNMS